MTAPCELEHCRGGKSNRWAKVQAFLYAQLHVTAQCFDIISLAELVEGIENEQHP
jgi:hypothetical protein